MAKGIDVRKVELPDFQYYESVQDTVPVTFIGRLKGLTEFGQQTLLQRKPFGTLLRKLVKARQRGESPDKPAWCAQFDLPSRVYNTALKYAEAAIASARECQRADWEDTNHEINRQVVEAFESPSGELQGRIRKLLRLYKKRNGLLKQQGRPPIHFGKKHYRRQDEAGWKAAYEEDRNDRIGCLGSADESGGNSTFQIRAVAIEDNVHFAVYHARKLIGRFHLKPKEQGQLEAILAINNQPFEFRDALCQQGKRKNHLVLRKITDGRVPLTVWFIRHENKRWYVHVSYIKSKVQPDYAPVGAIGVDLNCDSIASTKVQMADGAPLVVASQKHYFDSSWSRERKETWIYEQINQVVLEAKASQSMVVLEYLDFESSKRWLRNKLGAMLRVMPYRKMRQAFERRCLEHGVVFRYVKSHYTSILGALLTDYPNLGRDQAAAAVIGLRAMPAGNAWLEKKSKEVLAQAKPRLRINRKRQFGCTVTTDGVMIDRQSAIKPLDRETDTHWFQNRAAREISALSKAMGTHFFNKKVVPTRWKRPGPQGPWCPVVPKVCEAPLPRINCSSLSN